MPRTQTFSPSVFLIACGNERQERGKRAQRAGQNALELQHAALVEDDRVEVARLEAGLSRHHSIAASGNAGVVLAARQPLFLHRADRHAVDDERGGGVVIVRGDAEDLHRQYWLRRRHRSRSRGDRRPADRLAPLGALGQPRERRQQDEIHEREHARCRSRRRPPRRPADSASRAGWRAPARPAGGRPCGETRASCV